MRWCKIDVNLVCIMLIFHEILMYFYLPNVICTMTHALSTCHLEAHVVIFLRMSIMLVPNSTGHLASVNSGR